MVNRAACPQRWALCKPAVGSNCLLSLCSPMILNLKKSTCFKGRLCDTFQSQRALLVCPACPTLQSSRTQSSIYQSSNLLSFVFGHTARKNLESPEYFGCRRSRGDRASQNRCVLIRLRDPCARLLWVPIFEFNSDRTYVLCQAERAFGQVI
jgi:hypothetical protein